MLSLLLIHRFNLLDISLSARDVFLQKLYALPQQFVALLEVVDLLIAASDVIIDDRGVDGLDQELSLLSLSTKDLLRPRQDLYTSLNVRHLLFLTFVIAGVCWIRWTWLLQS